MVVKRLRKKFPLFLRYFLCLCFICSGILKALNVPAFAYEIRLYADFYLSDWMSVWSSEIAILVCTIEIAIGVFGLFCTYTMMSGLLFLVLLSFFVWLTGINYFSPTIAGSVESCGCFGELIHFTPLDAFVKSAVLLFVSVVNLWYAYKQCNKKDVVE